MLLSSSLLYSFLYFFLIVLVLCKALVTICVLTSLLVCLVYLGSLIVLFAYIWMYIPYTTPVSLHFFVFLVILLILSPFSFVAPSSFIWYLLGTAYLLSLSLLLFWAIVVVVHILDLSLGGFTS